MITVAIPNFNGGKYLKECLHSVLSQRLFEGKFNLAVVDDCSTDDSTEQIANVKKYWEETKDSSCVAKFDFVTSFLNEGTAVSRNKLIDIAKEQGSDYICFLDSDDFLKSKMTIQLMLKKMEEGYDWVHVYLQVGSEGDPDYHIERIEEGHGIEFLLADGYLFGCCTMFKISVLDAVGRYNKDIRFTEDFELYIRLLKSKAYKYGVVKHPLYYYRVHNQQKSRGGYDHHAARKAYFELNGIHDYK